MFSTRMNVVGEEDGVNIQGLSQLADHHGINVLDEKKPRCIRRDSINDVGKVVLYRGNWRRLKLRWLIVGIIEVYDLACGVRFTLEVFIEAGDTWVGLGSKPDEIKI
jgi:hypothetical protein